MTELFRFTVLGLGAGGLYSLAALGMVLVYRGSGIINFAQAAMGMVGAYAYFEMKVEHDLPTPIALVIGLSVAGLAGALFHLLVMRRMGDSSMLARIVATLALLVILQGGSLLVYGPLPKVVPSMLPVGPVKVLGAFVGADRLWIFAIVIVLTSVLWAFYRYSAFGVATTAVAENPRAAAALGVSPDVIATVNWVIGAALGGLAVIMLVPITGLHPDNITLLVIPVLAAAVMGRLSSFPATAAAGLLIGVSQSLVTRYHDEPGWSTAVPFVFVAVVLLARGRSVVTKDERFGRMPTLGDGRISPVLIAIGSAVALVCIWWVLPELWVYALMMQLILTIIVMSFVVVTGLAGQISLAQMTFAVCGAMGASWLMFHHGWSFAWALPGAMILTIPVGLIVGLAGLRTRGLNLAIVTLGFAVAFQAVVLGNRDYMRRVFGVRGPKLEIFGIDVAPPDHAQRYATLTLVLLVIVGVAIANLRRGRAGRRLIAVRTNERAAAALGVSVLGAKLYAFVLGGAIAGLGGVLLAYRTPFLSLGGFGSFQSILALQYAVLGGAGTVGGPLVGSGFNSEALGPKLFSFLGGDAALLLTVLGNVFLLVMLTVAPDGVAESLRRWTQFALVPLRRRFAFRATSAPLARLSVVDRGRVESKVLDVDALTVQFGGTVALDHVSLTVRPGEVVGLIGPNGAGKTTAIEAITGFVTPRAGSIRLDGVEVGSWSRERRAR
ncbi:MAG: ATP-binding cassette domain-containing protein, partial [Acidimicrobiia bacterium]